jgi:hypothetical protein
MNNTAIIGVAVIAAAAFVAVQAMKQREQQSALSPVTAAPIVVPPPPPPAPAPGTPNALQQAGEQLLGAGLDWLGKSATQWFGGLFGGK